MFAISLHFKNQVVAVSDFQELKEKGIPDAEASGFTIHMFVSSSVYRRLPTNTPRSRPTTIPPAAPPTIIRVSALNPAAGAGRLA